MSRLRRVLERGGETGFKGFRVCGGGKSSVVEMFRFLNWRLSDMDAR